MTKIKMTSGSFEWIARLEEETAPASSRWLLERLPLSIEMIQAAWSGKAVFSSLKGAGREVVFEGATSYPTLGQVLLYPGDDKGNQGELYMPYGGNCFACPTGQLAGNPFLTIIAGAERLEAFGRKVRWEGVQVLTFELLAE